MTPRSLLTMIGATALTLGTLVGGTALAPHVAAQDATGTPATSTTVTVPADASTTTGTTSRSAQREAFQQERVKAYQSFVASMAKELNVSTDAVDKAIRASLKQAVADQLAAGTITKEQAAAVSAVIDVADVPIFGGMGGPGMGGPGMGGPGMERGDGWGRGGDWGRGDHGKDSRDGKPGQNSGPSGSDDSDDSGSLPAPAPTA